MFKLWKNIVPICGLQIHIGIISIVSVFYLMMTVIQPLNYLKPEVVHQVCTFEILNYCLQCNNLKMIPNMFHSNSQFIILTNSLWCIHFLKITNLQTYEKYPSKFEIFPKVARSSYNLRIIFLYPLAGSFEYLFMFWLHSRDCQPSRPSIQNSPPKGMKE